MKRLTSFALLVLLLNGIVAAQGQEPEGARTPGWTVQAWQLAERHARRPRLAEGQTPNAYFVTEDLTFRERIASPYGPLQDRFVGKATTRLTVREAGTHRFRLTCDDGAALSIGGRLVVDTERSPGFTGVGLATLKPGAHELEIRFYEDEGRFHLKLEWSPPGSQNFIALPAGSFTTGAGQTFVTSPGTKKAFQGVDPRRPGDGRPLEGMHPSYRIEDFRPEGFEPAIGGMTLLPDGRLAVCTWDQQGSVWILDDVETAEGRSTKASLFANGLGEPLGLTCVDGVLHVAQKQEITRLLDLDGDGVADRYEVVAGGWPASHNYHEFTFNLLWMNGRFYTATSVPLKSGHTNYTPGVLPGRTAAYASGNGPGTLFEIDPEKGTWTAFATGLRTPNGLGIGPEGEMFVADNQGSWLPSSTINHVRRGGFYGHQETPEGKVESVPPVAWMPQDEIGNSPSQPVLVPDGPYVGQMLVGDVTHGGIKRLAVEKVDGVYQSALFRFAQGVEAGVNRLLFDPRGRLYVGGIGSDGNWHHKQKRFGLQRLAPTGEMPFEMARVSVREGGLLVTFTHPASAEGLEDAASWGVRSWRYERTIRYGGPKLGVRLLVPSAITASADRRQVFLALPDLQPDTVVHLKLDGIRATDGAEPWTTECWYTLNRLPKNRPGPGFDTAMHQRAQQLPKRPVAGAVVLVGEGAADDALVMKNGKPGFQWSRVADQIVVSQPAGDVVSRERFEDQFLHVEWLSPPGGDPKPQRNGNSGVKLQARYELQIMNSAGAPRPALFNESGSVYRIRPADHNASTGAGTWQTYDVWFRAPRWKGEEKVEDARMTVWWNGVLVHDDVVVPRATGRSVKEAPGPHPVLLQAIAQDAIGDVRFRNVWVLPDPWKNGLTPP